MKLVVSTVSFQKVPGHYAFRFSVHPEGVDKENGLIYGDVKTAESAARAWVKANDKFAKNGLKADEKALDSAIKAAERATESVGKVSKKAAERLAEQAALLEVKKARLNSFAIAGTFALVG